MDETDRLLHKSSQKSIGSDSLSIHSLNGELAPQILSPKSSFYKRFRGDSIDQKTEHLIKSPDNAISEELKQSESEGQKLTIPIDFELWGKCLLGAQVYDLPKRFLFYSERTGLLKSSTFESLPFDRDPGSLLSGVTFWLDINMPTSSEMNLLGRVFL